MAVLKKIEIEEDNRRLRKNRDKYRNLCEVQKSKHCTEIAGLESKLKESKRYAEDLRESVGVYRGELDSSNRYRNVFGGFAIGMAMWTAWLLSSPAETAVETGVAADTPSPAAESTETGIVLDAAGSELGSSSSGDPQANNETPRNHKTQNASKTKATETKDNQVQIAVEAAGDCCDPAWQNAKPAAMQTGWVQTANTEPHVLASVHMANGNSCSGTVLGLQGEKALVISCAHCVAGNIGKSCWWHNPNGKPFRAKLVAVDRSKDLSLFETDRKNVLAGVQVGSKWNTKSGVTFCGYPAGKGPKLRGLHYRKVQYFGKMKRWEFIIEAGPNIAGGDSGCGMFIDGNLCGVISHRGNSNNHSSTIVYTSAQDQVWSFLEQNAKKVQNCPPWGCPPRNQRNKPDKYGYQDEQAPAPPFTPQPNTPIIVPPRKDPGRGKDAEAIKGLRKENDEQSLQIDELFKKIAALKSQKPGDGKNGDRGQKGEHGKEGTAGIQGPTGPEGPRGAQGIAGRDGEDATIPVSLTNDMQDLLLRIKALEDKGELTTEQLVKLLPEIQIRVVDEDGKEIDSESYVLGEMITLYGRYKARKNADSK